MRHDARDPGGAGRRNLSSGRLADPGPRAIWATAVAIPLLALFAELLPVVFGTGEKASWDWSFLYITIRFIVLPLGGLLAGAIALGISLVSGARSWRRSRPATVLLVIAIAYDVALYLNPMPFFIPHPR